MADWFPTNSTLLDLPFRGGLAVASLVMLAWCACGDQGETSPVDTGVSNEAPSVEATAESISIVPSATPTPSQEAFSTGGCAWIVTGKEEGWALTTKPLELGFRSPGSEYPDGLPLLPLESRIISGDRTLLDVQAVVRYRVSDQQKFVSGLHDPNGECPDGRVLRNTTLGVLGEAVGKRGAVELVTSSPGDADLESETHEDLQRVLDSFHTGIEVVSVRVVSVQLPPEVCGGGQGVEHKSAFGGVSASGKMKALGFNQLVYLDIGPQQLLTWDKRAIVAYPYSVYRVVDVTSFGTNQIDQRLAEARVRELIVAGLEEVVAQHTIEKLVGATVEPGQEGQPYTVVPLQTDGGVPSRSALLTLATLAAAEEALRQWGVEIVSVGVGKLGLGVDAEQSTYSRMRAEPRLADLCEQQSK